MEAPFRIVLVTPPTGAPARDGVADYVDRLEAHLTALPETGLPDAGHPGTDLPDPHLPGTEVTRLPLPARDPRPWWRAARTLRAIDPHAFLFQYPYEAWGRSPLPPLYALLLWALGGRPPTTVTWHEWIGLHPLRRLSTLPFLLFSRGAIHSTPEGRDSFAEWVLPDVRITSRFIPVGSTVRRGTVDRELAERIRREHRIPESSLVLGTFGFLYPGKRPETILETAGLLRREGIDVRLVLAGDFNVDHGSLRRRFLARARELGLTDRILHLGYIEDPDELVTRLSVCDAVLLLFSDGLTARRSSFWYCVEHGLPVITTHPTQSEESARLSARLAPVASTIRWVEREAPPEAIAAVLRSDAPESRVSPPPAGTVAPSWSEIAERIRAFLGQVERSVGGRRRT